MRHQRHRLQVGLDAVGQARVGEGVDRDHRRGHQQQHAAIGRRVLQRRHGQLAGPPAPLRLSTTTARACSPRRRSASWRAIRSPGHRPVRRARGAAPPRAPHARRLAGRPLQRGPRGAVVQGRSGPQTWESARAGTAWREAFAAKYTFGSATVIPSVCLDARSRNIVQSEPLPRLLMSTPTRNRETNGTQSPSGRCWATTPGPTLAGRSRPASSRACWRSSASRTWPRGWRWSGWPATAS